MRRHAEAVGNRFVVFLFFVDAVLRAPPPGLMNERSVGRVHQADDAMINADGHFGLQVGEFVFLAEFFNRWCRIRSFRRSAETRALRAGIRYIDPYEIVLLFAGIASSINAIDFDHLVRSK